jgi:hypothetical protein
MSKGIPSVLAGILGLWLGGCGRGPSPNAARIDDDLIYFTKKVQHRTDKPARLCHRATTAAAVASANFQARFDGRGEVPAELYRQLSVADQVMQQACKPFR